MQMMLNWVQLSESSCHVPSVRSAIVLLCMLYLIMVSLLLSLNVCIVHLMPMVVYCCSYSSCAFSLLVMNIMVASCRLSRASYSSVCYSLYTCTHTT
jgi:hypothetical protein